MKNVWLLVGSLGVTVFIVIAVAVLFTKKANAPVLPSDPNIVLGNARFSKGETTSKITIVEFSDLQCPACKATQPLVDEIMKEASTSARLVYRQFPLRSVHKNALAAAKAAEAAGVQGKFWEMHDKLFANQTDWEEDADPAVHFEGYAKEVGLNVDTWKKDFQDKKLETKIERDEQDGNTLGVNATPTFFVNNVKTDVSDLKDTVDKLLAQ